MHIVNEAICVLPIPNCDWSKIGFSITHVTEPCKTKFENLTLKHKQIRVHNLFHLHSHNKKLLLSLFLSIATKNETDREHEIDFTKVCFPESWRVRKHSAYGMR